MAVRTAGVTATFSCVCRGVNKKAQTVSVVFATVRRGTRDDAHFDTAVFIAM